jgi:hypothetical protein
MRALQKITAALPRAAPTIPAVRTIATRTTTIDTLHARHNPTPRQADQPTATSPNSGVEYTPSQPGGIPHQTNPTEQPPSPKYYHPLATPENRARSFYSTQIYHGQASPTPSPTPATRRGIHSSAHHGPAPGPATGAGTGVLISAHMFGSEVKGNPTESEADVAADRSDYDPLPPELHRTICLGAGEAAPRPTESEEDVAADRGGAGEDPLRGVREKRG